MAGYTYTTLKQAIQDYTDNQETTFVNNLDNIIRNAEERILKTIPLETFRKNASATMTASNQYLNKPSDWLVTYSVSIVVSGTRKFLQNKDVNFIQDYWPTAASTGEPVYYADFDVSKFIIAPTPSSAYPLEIEYYYRPTSLVDAASGTTWLSQNAGPAMLFSCLAEAYMFIKGEPDMIQVYEQKFQESLQNLGVFSQIEGIDFLRRTSA